MHYKNAWVWVKDHSFSDFIGKEFGKSTPLLYDDSHKMRAISGANRWEKH